ncbi:MAG: YbjN domain-containing protein [Rhodoferax ferrireducens]|uniref:YbjN domain-containing protein n=1 Tax=Rhodoferax ferrireducens TaxID=192843 RepID=A0A1W9KP82_9BURK|nr:MAG: YbjN domain-containing protein [Rhodoferax ferrireducens]
MTELIEEKDVTPVNLALALERAVIAHDLDEDQSIYVKEDGWFTFWIWVRKGTGYVHLKTHTHFKKSTTQLQRLEICNEFNKSKFMLTCYESRGRLCFDHALNFRDGLLHENFVRSCRQFAKSIETGLADTDPDNVFVLQPGETAPEDETGDQNHESK